MCGYSQVRSPTVISSKGWKISVKHTSTLDGKFKPSKELFIMLDAPTNVGLFWGHIPYLDGSSFLQVSIYPYIGIYC